jgi:hypothetical protein
MAEGVVFGTAPNTFIRSGVSFCAHAALAYTPQRRKDTLVPS